MDNEYGIWQNSDNNLYLLYVNGKLYGEYKTIADAVEEIEALRLREEED